MNEKKIGEESKICTELRKSNSILKKKLDKQNKDKSDNVNQLKSLFALFTQ